MKSGGGKEREGSEETESDAYIICDVYHRGTSDPEREAGLNGPILR